MLIFVKVRYAFGNLSPCKIQAFTFNFLVKKFSVNRQSLQIFSRIARKSAEVVRLRKISSPGN